MIYEAAEHAEVEVGQRWASAEPNQWEVVIVAIDTSPSGHVMNVLIQDEVVSVLAPVVWSHLGPHLGALLRGGADVSEQLDAYVEWKAAAQAGQAGVWTCSPAAILSQVRGLDSR